MRSQRYKKKGQKSSDDDSLVVDDEKLTIKPLIRNRMIYEMVVFRDFCGGAEQSKNETDQMIVLEWLFLTIAPCDAAEPWQLGSQDAATPMMQGIIDLHHDIFFFLILILVFVSRILVRALWHFQKDKNLIPQRIVHGTTIEILWTTFPSIIPMFIAIPSFALLYLMDEVVVNLAITIKAIGHQWYQSVPLHEGDLSVTKCLKNMVCEASSLPKPMVPSCCCWRYTSLFLMWSDIREIDAQPEMSDNAIEVVNLLAPWLWHTTLDLTADPVTFRNRGSLLATTTVVVAELLGQERTTSCSCSSFYALGMEVLR
ncbi:cytochrome c oxidase subunit 2 [Tanacetum coccineum]